MKREKTISGRPSRDALQQNDAGRQALPPTKRPSSPVEMAAFGALHERRKDIASPALVAKFIREKLITFRREEPKPLGRPQKTADSRTTEQTKRRTVMNLRRRLEVRAAKGDQEAAKRLKTLPPRVRKWKAKKGSPRR